MVCLFFFFQAEDGIRDVAVTGVQTCALPICPDYQTILKQRYVERPGKRKDLVKLFAVNQITDDPPRALREQLLARIAAERSEERRVGKECRSRRSPNR